MSSHENLFPAEAMASTTQDRLALLPAPFRVLHTLPTELRPPPHMLDAARGLFLYFDFDPRTTMTLGQHLAAGGYPTAGLTAEQLAHRGVFPKGERAAMVWAVMVAAAKRR